MKLVELIEAAGGGQVTARFVRFLITEGVIGPPSGGRTHADYDANHLRGVLSYLRLRELGFSLTQVKDIFKAERGETVPVEIAPGITLHIDLANLDRGLTADSVADRARRVLLEFLNNLPTDGDIDHVRSA